MSIAVGPGTVIVIVCVTPFSVAVIVTVPPLFPVTFPLASTIAICGLLDIHVT